MMENKFPNSLKIGFGGISWQLASNEFFKLGGQVTGSIPDTASKFFAVER